ncbi:FecR family protein [Nibrella saemangeumensis]|uniref:FecR family protein n=1 Tax=Nibrella saemangeumensis TaxID=1084526 RepID=A0ABP8MTZ0_9BACT
MNYQQYTINDYLQDDDFLQWVFAPSVETDRHWQQVLQTYPEQRENLHQARQLILQLAKAEKRPDTSQTVSEIWDTIAERTRPQRQRPFFTYWWRVAAASVAILLLAYWGWQQWSTGSGDEMAFTNPTASPVWVALPDSSRVSLQPGSKVTYTDNKENQQREVRLTGQAFFQVTRNPQRPFLVFADQTITRVLGTSFWVKATPARKKVEVDVISGKVSVREDASSGKTQPEQVVLLPNQRVVYSTETGQLTPGLVEHPVALESSIPSDQLLFEDTSLKTITARLSSLYGIPISLLNKHLQACVFTGDVNNMSLYETLDLVCRSVKAKYEVRGMQIVITGAGCP